jgi:hypothetical protein
VKFSWPWWRTPNIPLPPLKRVDPKLPDWAALIHRDADLWIRARQRAGSPRVLIATSVGGHSALSLVESLLAVALTLRGASVDVLLCDHALPACLRCEMPEVPDPATIVRGEIHQRLCPGCFATGRALYEPIGLPIRQFTDRLDATDRQHARALATDVPLAEIQEYRVDGCAVGEHSYAGALRYFASGNLAAEALGEPVARRYFEGGLLTVRSVGRLLRDHRYDVAVFNHGIYSPQGVVAEACRAAGVRVVNWNVAYRKQCFIFSPGDTYHHTLLNEPVEAWERMPWTSEMESRILAYLKSRLTGSRDWIWFHEKPDEDFTRFAAQSGIDLTRPTIGMLTNVMWDAQLHYRANAFPNILAWAVETIRYFAGRPDLQLLIRVHPAEIRGTLTSRQPILAELAKVFPALPANVFAIPPESPVSTYAAMMKCDSVIIYGTKTGVELTSLGIPVIVGGEAWIRNKGLTLDASSPDEYRAILDSLPIGRRMDEAQLRRARMYAYHFFFRRMIPLGCMQPTGDWPPYRVAIESLRELTAGHDAGLDVICDGVLRDQPFIYPAERFGVHDA